ncbi:hypothetical protein GALL_457920 [mine drainage metagenome]|uniref:Uncharacterized protein n=1 Tax=mine drainage metagenome TaxID=410659 RepID=A0A1J5PM22_9ZZZZ
MRRYALARFGHADVAKLSGQRWIDFVVAQGGTDWGGGSGSDLLRAAYGGSFAPARKRWIAGARAFFKVKG